MGIQVRWVRYGRDAAEALRASIAAAKGEEPLAPVTVVVPSNHVGVAARRLLASGALGPVSGKGIGVAAVTFVTPYRLGELLGAATLAGAGRRPVSTPVVAAALRSVLVERPGLFAPVAHHPATETALVAAYRELRDVSAAALDALAATGPRAADVVRIHRAARARLEGSWYDEQDLLLAARQVVAGGGPAVGELGAVVVHLPQRLSRHSALLISAVADQLPVVVLAGSTGVPRADAEVGTSVARLGAPAAAPSDLDPALDQGRPGPVVAADRTRILTASDSDDEVRTAVRAVVDAVRRGVPLDRIAILHASPEPYARLVHEQLAAAGIPANGAAVVPLAARVAGRTLLQLPGLAEGGFRRRDVFAWMNAAPVRHRGQPAPVAAWERLSRDAAVVAGRHDWDVLLAGLAERLDADAVAAAEDPDEPAWKADRSRQDAERARQLRLFVLELIDELAGAATTSRRWGDHARWAGRLLDRWLGPPDRRHRWPADERKAADRVAAALDRLAALDAVEGHVALDVFSRTLELELEADLGRVGRFGEGVLVGSVAMGAGLDLDLVVVLGLAEGSFPTTPRDDSLLPDDERESAGGELPLRRAAVDRQHRELLAALAGASRHLLCVPRGDLRRSSERVPSRWLLDLASQLAGERWWSDDLLRATAPWIEHVPSFDAGLRRLSFPATGQEHRLRALLAGVPAGHGTDVLTGWLDPVVAAGATVVAARRSPRFTRFDGNLGALSSAIPSPVNGTTSSTRLERWADCPYAYLMRYVLSVEAVENPEEELRITPIDRGNLVHQALEQFITEVLSRPSAEQPGPDQPWSDADRARMRAIGEHLCDEYERRGRTGRPIFWRRDRRAILADLQRFLDADSDHRRRHGTRPLAAELAFGFRGSPVAAAPLVLADGRVVQFLGKADRIDVGDDGTLHIVDYKTGKIDGYKKLSQEDPDQRGRRLQLAVYGVAARLHHEAPDAPVRAEYWFVSSRGRFERKGYDVTPEVLARVGATLGTMVEGIEAGVFPPHPTDKPSTTPWVECPYCDPDALGVTELRRHWDRKRQDPALARFADLAEPLDQPSDADEPAGGEPDGRPGGEPDGDVPDA